MHESQLYADGEKNEFFVTVQTGLCIYCTDRTKERIQHAASPSQSDFNWLDARNSEGI